MTEKEGKSRSALRRLLSVAPLFAAMAVCYAAGEFYPFSAFPMYSKFDDRTYLVYLRDAEGKPLPTIPVMGMPSSAMKKRYGAELKELKDRFKGSHYDWPVEQKTAAGKATLAYLRNTFNPEAFDGGRLKGAQLVDLRIRLEKGKLKQTEEVVGVVD